MILCRSLCTKRYVHISRNAMAGNARQVPSPCVRDITCVLSREVRGRKEAMALAVSYDEDPSMLALEAVAASLTRKILNGQYPDRPESSKRFGHPKGGSHYLHGVFRICGWAPGLACQEEERKTLPTTRRGRRDVSCFCGLRNSHGMKKGRVRKKEACPTIFLSGIFKETTGCLIPEKQLIFFHGS